jgi:hypothetical protein
MGFASHHWWAKQHVAQQWPGMEMGYQTCQSAKAFRRRVTKLLKPCGNQPAIAPTR